MPGRLLGVLRHEAFELRLGVLMLEVSLAGPPKDIGELRPGIGRAHVDDPHRLDAGPRWIDAEDARGLAVLHAAPEFLFRGQQEVLVEGVGGYLDLDPLAAAGDHRERRASGIGHPHIVLELRHVLFGRGFLRERPRQHELGLEHRPAAGDDAVEGRPHIHRSTGCCSRCWTHATVCPVLRSYQFRLRASVTRPSWTMRLPERSSGSASPRFSRHRRTRAASSLPMMIRASEPPRKPRRPKGSRNPNSTAVIYILSIYS